MRPEPENPHDANAVAAFVRGRKVGHLSRAEAAEFVTNLADLQPPHDAALTCRGRIRGGWYEEQKEEAGMLGVAVYFAVPLRTEIVT